MPNPLSDTGYDELPSDTAKALLPYFENNMLNFVRWCGTTPDHIAEILKTTSGFKPKIVNDKRIKPL